MILGTLLAGVIGAVVTAGVASAAEINVLGSPGTRAPYTLLVPGFEAASGHKVTTTWGGVVAVTKRVSGGETADVVMLPSPQIDELIKLGKLSLAPRSTSPHPASASPYVPGHRRST
jgi:molybdate transport system substrate-binding protein